VNATRPDCASAVALMNQFDASNMDAPSVQCAVCENLITGGRWFARIAHGNRIVALCCPLCAEVFQSNPQPYCRRIEMLEHCLDTQQIMKNS